MVTVAELGSGFADKVLSAQSTFRAVMDAMARPGSVQRTEPLVTPPAPMMRGAAAIALTLFDNDTPVWLDAPLAASHEVSRWIKFHASAPIVTDSSICSFALIADGRALPALDRFSFGSNEYPDRSTTLIVQAESVTEGPAIEMRGPGISGMTVLRASVQPMDLFDRLTMTHAIFPRGIDLVLVADDAIVAIPRTTRLIARGS